MAGGLVSIIAFLTFVWFLAYWIFGSAFFVVIRIFGSRKIRRIQFSCTYSLLCLLTAYGASRTGLVLSGEGVEEAFQSLKLLSGATVDFFTAGFAGITLAGIIWFIITILIGFILLALARSKEKVWWSEEESQNNNSQEGITNHHEESQ